VGHRAVDEITAVTDDERQEMLFARERVLPAEFVLHLPGPPDAAGPPFAAAASARGIERFLPSAVS